MIRLRRVVPAVLALTMVSCWDFQPDPVPGPSPVTATRFVDVQIEYRQPAHCANTQGTCDARVVFFGSWMRPKSGDYAGDQVLLDTPFGPNFWTGVVHNVPVNWPPTDEPHLVRVYDPHLQDSATGGVTAARLTVGGQVLTFYQDTGTTSESGLVYVDDGGVGHNPY